MTTQTGEVINLNDGSRAGLGLGVLQTPPEEMVGSVEAAIATVPGLVSSWAVQKHPGSPRNHRTRLTECPRSFIHTEQ